MPESTRSKDALKDTDLSEFFPRADGPPSSTKAKELVEALIQQALASTPPPSTLLLSLLDSWLAELRTHIADATDPDVRKKLEETYQKLQKIHDVIAPRTDDMERLLAEIIAGADSTQGLLQESASLNILTDSSVDPQVLAEFLAELSSIYGELSDGDELVIDRTPAEAEVLA